ncbi:uncharacterized protein LOC118224069 [Anguilla anguilla]|uniref:uncharacterized protein LOC118224069 n=1 Tax=Anguilla anguilla TaxID=7936 RepID=UPI0015B1CF91|nr:uncharacterized protein LOC118224069 [Anguilla anguilla]XP_035267136.1 uncharacterized protein LOC118224069 [Anguilla anguilla]
MNQSSPCYCIAVYLNLCATSKAMLLVPGFVLNVFVLASLASSFLSRRSKIKKNVAMFILSSTTCNIINMTLWPLMVHWRDRGHWALGWTLCEIMVNVKHITSSASFHYTFFISFSVYLTIVCGWSRVVDRKTFLALQLLFPIVPVLIKGLTQHLLGNAANHLDVVNRTCFSYINDRAMRILILVKIVAFVPLNLYFYAHILHTTFRSAKQMNRSQAANKRLAKTFGVISLITVIAHIPGGAFSLLAEQKICLETVMEFLQDLPNLSSPIILLCMNKELRDQCVLLLQRRACSQHRPGFFSTGQHKTLPRSETLQSNL